MTCHLINKAVMKKNCVEALNQHAQPLEKKAATINAYRNPTHTTRPDSSKTLALYKSFTYLLTYKHKAN